jgi:hypothetical protein
LFCYANKNRGGFGFGTLYTLYLVEFYPAMTYNPAPVQINPDPRFLTIVVIGTAENVETYIRDQHLRGYAKTYEWSKPQPAPDGSEKVLVALNRIMV